MNAQETLALLRELRASGATHFKSQDFEVTLNASHASQPQELPSSPPDLEPKSAGDVAPNADNTEKLKALIDTLKMDDASLIDKIFPAGAGG